MNFNQRRERVGTLCRSGSGKFMEKMGGEFPEMISPLDKQVLSVLTEDNTEPVDTGKRTEY